ncbi:MAG: lysophospholipid acyltransferase family protein [Gemmatimonadaceae bacterium]|nr:lysophospholipid acyltransferase family protein [Gemmatimonadaceae bacterium]
MGRHLREAAEYILLRSVTGVLNRLSFRRAGAVGEWIGRLGYHPVGIRRDVVVRHIRAAFPDWPPEEVERVARAAYGSLGRTTIEAAVISSGRPGEVLDHFEGADGWEYVEQARAAGRGLIIVTGHLGNWELGGAYVIARGVPVDAVARHMANPHVDGYFTRARERAGARIIHDERAVREVPRAIRDNRAVAMLFDQGAVGLASTWVKFFGRYAKTPRGPATFALRLKAPVVFMAAVRQPSGRYRLIMEPISSESTGDREADIDRIVAEYTDALERWVRRYPEQYFWHHRRWKHQRPGTPPELGEP